MSKGTFSVEGQISAIRDAANDWFFDVMCTGKDYKTQDDFIDAVYKMIHSTNEKDINRCYDSLCEIFNKKMVEDYWNEMVDELSACAEEVWFSFEEDDMIPERYAC